MGRTGDEVVVVVVKRLGATTEARVDYIVQGEEMLSDVGKELASTMDANARSRKYQKWQWQ